MLGTELGNMFRQRFCLAGRGRIRAGAPADLVLVPGKPDEAIEDTQSIETVWKSGQPATPGAYPGSPAESAGIEFLRQQTQRVISAVQEKFPEFGAADGLGLPDQSE